MNPPPHKKWNDYEKIIVQINEGKELSNELELNFLIDLGLLKNGQLSELGEKYYFNKFCCSDNENTNKIIISQLLTLDYVKLLLDTFWGRSKIKKENIIHLFKLFKYTFSINEINNIFSILNQFKVITYSKKLDNIKINFKPNKLIMKDKYFIHPDTPYSNQKTYETIFDNSESYVYWFEKHFSSKMYDVLLNNVNGNKVSLVRLLTTDIGVNEKTKKICEKLRAELNVKKVVFEHKIIQDKKIVNQIHGRWISSKNFTYNVPPINSVFMGQADEIHRTDDKFDFMKWWGIGANLSKLY